MGFWTIEPKLTQTERPAIDANKKLTSAEFNLLTGTINANYQEHLDLVDVVATLEPLPYVRFDVDFLITSPGIYVFFGNTGRTLAIEDGVSGLIEVRTTASAELTLSGTFNANHLGTIGEGSSVTFFRWDPVSLEYTF